MKHFPYDQKYVPLRSNPNLMCLMSQYGMFFFMFQLNRQDKTWYESSVAKQKNIDSNLEI